MWDLSVYLEESIQSFEFYDLAHGKARQTESGAAGLYHPAELVPERKTWQV